MKRVIRITLTAIIMIAFSSNVSAQNEQAQEKKKCRMEMAQAQAKQIAHELALDDATRQKFIETFCAYQKDLWALCPKGNNQKKVDMTDAEVEKNIKDRFEHRQKVLTLRQDYYNKYNKFLTPKQIQRVYELEKQAMNRLSKHGNGNAAGRGNAPGRPKAGKPNAKGKGKHGSNFQRQPKPQNAKE